MDASDAVAVAATDASAADAAQPELDFDAASGAGAGDATSDDADLDFDAASGAGAGDATSDDADLDFDAELALEVPAEFAIRDADGANWVIRKILDARAYALKCHEWARREVERARRDEAFFLARFGPQLEQWARDELAAQGKKRRKSVPLPAGVIGWKQEPLKIVVEDEPKTIEWARTNCPDAIKLVEELRKTPLNEAFRAGGVIPDGCRLVEPADKFYVK